MREAAAERAAIAHLRIADVAARTPRSPGTPCAAAPRSRRRDATVPAPISILPSFSRMPASPGMRAMSISTVGSLSRSFISGTRLWPPAISLPPPLLARSFASASSIDVARLYSNVVGSRPPSLARLDDAPQLFGPQHHVDVLHAELAERVDGCDDDARRRAERAGFADAFRAERIAPALASPWRRARSAGSRSRAASRSP